MTKERKVRYENAAKQVKTLEGILDNILNSQVTEARACKDAEYPLATFRRFCKETASEDGADKVRVMEKDWSDNWREELLFEITGERIPAPDDFDVIFEDICHCELSGAKEDVLKMRLDGVTYADIANERRMTADRVRGIENKALKILRRPDCRLRLAYGEKYYENFHGLETAQAKYDELWLKKRIAKKQEIQKKMEALAQENERISEMLWNFAETTPNIPLNEKAMCDVPLRDMGLSVQANQCLRQFFEKEKVFAPTAWDIALLANKNFAGVENLRQKYRDNILNCLTERFDYHIPDIIAIA